MPQIVRCDSAQDVGVSAAEALSSYLQGQPESLVALPTGRTVEPMYRRLTELQAASLFDPSRAMFYALDEVVCRSGRRPFLELLLESLVEPCRIDLSRFRVLDPTSGNSDLECRCYEQEIEEKGGLDVAVLGIGRNGHIAFNEPGSSFESVTRRVQLADDTKEAVAEAFGVETSDIAGALTVGIATILRSKKLLLMATGEEKAEALANALTGPPDTGCPASALGLHSDTTVIADTRALALMR